MAEVGEAGARLGDFVLRHCRSGCFVGRCRVGHVECEEALGTRSHATRQQGPLPTAVVRHRPDGQQPVDVVLEGGRRGDGQILQLAEQHRRHIGEHLVAGGGVEGMQHAVIGTDIDAGDRVAAGVQAVVVVEGAAADDGTHLREAFTIAAARIGRRALVGRIAAQVRQPLGPLGCITQRGLLRGADGGQPAPLERNAGARWVGGEYLAAGVPRHVGQLAAGAPFDRCVAIGGHVVGHQVAVPCGADVVTSEGHRASAGNVVAIELQRADRRDGLIVERVGRVRSPIHANRCRHCDADDQAPAHLE